MYFCKIYRQICYVFAKSVKCTELPVEFEELNIKQMLYELTFWRWNSLFFKLNRLFCKIHRQICYVFIKAVYCTEMSVKFTEMYVKNLKIFLSKKRCLPGLESQRSRKRFFFNRKIFKFFKYWINLHFLR